MTGGTNGNGDQYKGIFSKRTLDLIVIGQIVLNVVVLSLIIAGVLSATLRLNEQAEQQRQAIRAQVEFVQDQNDKQICVQHEIILAITKLGHGLERRLSLPPLADITVPDVQNLDCQRLLGLEEERG